MAILRINKTKDYTTMSNYHFKDKRLSLKAKGLLSEMLSLPENWDYSIAGLVAINKEEETAIKSTLDELKQFNYLVVNKLMPNETESGRYEYVYDIYEMPKKQEGDFLGVEIQGVEIQGVENQGQYNTNNKINNNIDLLDNNKGEEVFDYYQQEIGQLTPRQYEVLNTYIDKLDPLLIKEAINITVDSGAKTMNYLKAVLNNFIAKGYKCITDLETPVRTDKNSELEEDIELFDYDWLNDKEN